MGRCRSSLDDDWLWDTSGIELLNKPIGEPKSGGNGIPVIPDKETASTYQAFTPSLWPPALSFS